MKKARLRIRVMAEYGSSGVWGYSAGNDGGFRHGMIEHVELGLPPDLSRRLASWIEQYEEHNLAGTLDTTAFNAEGHLLATLLKAHLGPERHVEFQGEAPDGGLLRTIVIG